MVGFGELGRRRVMARQAWLVIAGQRSAWFGVAGQPRHGWVWRVEAGRGSAGEAMRVPFWKGWALHGSHGWLGMACLGGGKRWLVSVSQRGERHGRLGLSGRGWPVTARFVEAVGVCRALGEAWPGKARRGSHGAT